MSMVHCGVPFVVHVPNGPSLPSPTHTVSMHAYAMHSGEPVLKVTSCYTMTVQQFLHSQMVLQVLENCNCDSEMEHFVGDKLAFDHLRPPGGVANAALPACRSSGLVRPSSLPATVNRCRTVRAMKTRAIIALGVVLNLLVDFPTPETSTIEL